MSKKIIVSVISDIVTDQRVQKECNTLHNMGYNVLLLGRKSKENFLLNELPYKVIRFHNLFRRGPLMYLCFNVQLFFYLLFKRADVLWANDLDTLSPNFIISRLKGCKLVYDSHEYFTLSVYKKTSRRIWQRLEKFLFPHLKNVITVNDSIKQVYEEKYHVPVTVLRNLPYLYNGEGYTRKSIIHHKKILVMQGRGLNENRGAEEAILMMQFLPGEFNLYFIGTGTIMNKLKEMVDRLQLSSKVSFLDVMPYSEMMEYTRQSFLGLIFEKIDITDHHRFALPNKFFDYIHAGIPLLSSKATEIVKLVNKYHIGTFIDNFQPEDMAQKVIDISKNIEQYNSWKYNTAIASSELNWDIEEKVLVNFMDKIL